MKYLSLLILLAMLAGCQPIDPLGATERTNIRANAALQAAQAEADAQRRIAEAQADAQKHVANQETIRAGMWAGVLPVALLIVGATLVIALVVNWQGRIWHERTKMGAPSQIAQRMQAQQPAIELADLRKIAASRGYWLEIEGNVAYLVDEQGERRGRRLLSG